MKKIISESFGVRDHGRVRGNRAEQTEEFMFSSTSTRSGYNEWIKGRLSSCAIKLPRENAFFSRKSPVGCGSIADNTRQRVSTKNNLIVVLSMVLSISLYYHEANTPHVSDTHIPQCCSYSQPFHSAPYSLIFPVPQTLSWYHSNCVQF